MPKPARKSSRSKRRLTIERTVAYSPDGKRLTHVSVSDGKSSTMTVWDAQTGRELLTQKTHGQVTSVAFSPDGKRLVTGAGWVVGHRRPD